MATITGRNYLGGPLMRVIRDAWAEDQYSTTTEWSFAIADAMYREGYEIPAEWEYRPGVDAQVESDEDAPYAYHIVWEMIGDACVTEDELRRTGTILMRYAAQLRLAGQNY